MDEYLVSWNIPFNEDLLEGGIEVSRTPGSKSIWADVVRLEEGQYLEVYGLQDNLVIDGPWPMGVIYDSGKTFEIDDFIENLAEPKDLCVALRNRGTEIMELEKEADEIICGTFNETSGHLVSLDVTDRDIIDPGFSAFICLGSVADLNGNASIGLKNGENISFTWDTEESPFENPEETSTDSSGNNSGGCLVSWLSFNSFVLLIPLLLLIVKFRFRRK